MTTEQALIDSALRTWKANVDRAGKLFGALSEEQLRQEIAPGKNRLVYLWGHLAAVDDALFPLLALGKRRHPELDATFLTNPDRTAKDTPPKETLQHIWTEIHDALWNEFTKLSPSQWLERHTSVTPEDFDREPHRNRFTILLGRTAHLAYHIGQAQLAKRQ